MTRLSTLFSPDPLLTVYNICITWHPLNLQTNMETMKSRIYSIYRYHVILITTKRFWQSMKREILVWSTSTNTTTGGTHCITKTFNLLVWTRIVLSLYDVYMIQLTQVVEPFNITVLVKCTTSFHSLEILQSNRQHVVQNNELGLDKNMYGFSVGSYCCNSYRKCTMMELYHRP